MAPDCPPRLGCSDDMMEELEAKLLSFLSRASLLFPVVGLEKILLGGGVVTTSFSDSLTLSLPPD